jgi:nonribosomal peptide synthetase DhbF
LIARVRQEIGITLPLRALFEFATPAGLALQLADKSIKTYNPLVALRKTGKYAPIFCIHGGGGIGTVYSNLSNAFGEEYPVYGIQARGLEDGEELHTSINEMTDEYIKAIRTIQASGPYHLLGWSLGGTLAHEITCKLEEMGEEVSLLALLDTKAVYEKHDQLEGLTMKQSIVKLAKDYGVELDESENLHLEFIRELLVGQDLIPEGTPLDWVERAFKQLAATPDLTRNHQTKVCKAPILFFNAEQEDRTDNQESYLWNKHTNAPVHTYSIDSLHNTMMKQSAVSNIARHIKQYLNQR